MMQTHEILLGPNNRIDLNGARIDAWSGRLIMTTESIDIEMTYALCDLDYLKSVIDEIKEECNFFFQVDKLYFTGCRFSVYQDVELTKKFGRFRLFATYRTRMFL